MKGLLWIIALIGSVSFGQSRFRSHLLEAWLANNQPIDIAEIDAIEKQVFQDYVAALKADLARYSAHREGHVQLSERTMHYSGTIIGDKPDSGYPLYIALHGGGELPKSQNDRQWERMKTFYRNSIDTGIYVAVRGISDSWDLHSRPHSYPLYDKLIENMIAYEGIDPNRVYLLGFSAGGDGVYQVSARMPDRWAACSMSAGHPNGINATNMINTPLLLQVGELDSEFNRNRAAVNYYEMLRAFSSDRGGYWAELFLHKGAGHNNWSDHDPLGRTQPVLEFPMAWRDLADETTIMRDTNAINWLKPFKRNAHPRRVIWHTPTRAPLRGHHSGSYISESHAEGLSLSQNQMYWLEVDGQECGGHVVADYFMDSNSFEIQVSDSKCHHLSLLLSQKMVDDESEIEVYVNGSLKKRHHFAAHPNIMVETLLSRGDPQYMFHDRIDVRF